MLKGPWGPRRPQKPRKSKNDDDAPKHSRLHPYKRECVCCASHDNRWTQADPREGPVLCVICRKPTTWVDPEGKPRCPWCWDWAEDAKASRRPKREKPQIDFFERANLFPPAPLVQDANIDDALDAAVAKKRGRGRKKKQPDSTGIPIVDWWICYVCRRCYAVVTSGLPGPGRPLSPQISELLCSACCRDDGGGLGLLDRRLANADYRPLAGEIMWKEDTLDRP